MDFKRILSLLICLPRTLRMEAKAGLVLLLFVAACAGTSRPAALAKTDQELRLGRFDLAYQELRKGLEKNPRNEALLSLEKPLRVRALLSKAQDLLFQDRPEEALSLLARAETLDPNYRPVQIWLAKAREKLARLKVAEGTDSLQRGKLEQSLAAFQRALSVKGDDAQALQGLRDVSEIFAGRREKAKDHYRLALRALENDDFDSSRYHASIALEQDPSLSEAKNLIERADIALAEFSKKHAMKLAQEKRWAAASKAMSRAAELAEEAGLDWAPKARQTALEYADEAKGMGYLDEARIFIEKKQFDKAEELVNKAKTFCKRNLLPLNEVLSDLRVKRAGELGEEAKNLLREGKLEEAFSLYLTLQKMEPEGLWKDKAIQLRDRIRRVKDLYQKAMKLEQEGKLAEAIPLLRECVALYPAYKDVAVRYRRALKATQKNG
jgi:tetratricopeptide (TPR) repeat protein